MDKKQNLSLALEDHSEEGIAILSSEPSRLMAMTIYLLTAVLLAGLIWSFIGHADVIVKAQGKLGPEQNERRVYAPVDGELVELLIAEGMPVTKNDVLARINSPTAIESATRAGAAELKLLDAEANYAMYPARRKVLEQQIEGLKFQIAAAEKAQEKRLTESIAKLSEAQKLKLEKARVKLERARLDREDARLDWAKYRRLYNSPGGGGVSRSKVEEKENQYLAKDASYRLARAELGEFEIELSRAYTSKTEEIQKKAEQLLELYARLEEKKVALESLRIKTESQLKLARAAARGASRVRFKDIDENNYLRIRAPVDGVVTLVGYKQLGEKVLSRQPVAGIAPADARMVLHIEIPEKDRAFLHQGMEVKLKFNAFPYQRYGFITGTLDYISPTATVSAAGGGASKGKLVYKGKVSLARTWFEVAGKRYPLRYGMTATGEIVVRKRRLIDLALDPFRNVVG